MAIDDLLDEHEQGERVRNWLRSNGAGLVGGVLLGLAIIGGWQWWQKREQAQRIDAGDRYQAALKSIKAGNLKLAQPLVAGLDGGTYATLAAMDLAKAQLDAGQRDDAIATLRATKPADPALARVVGQRLARLLIDSGKANEALQLLAAQPADADILEIRADAQFALGDHDKARATYAQALAKLDVGAPQRRLLELKLSQAGGMPVKPEAQS